MHAVLVRMRFDVGSVYVLEFEVSNRLTIA